jgi:hypothetical protein
MGTHTTIGKTIPANNITSIVKVIKKPKTIIHTMHVVSIRSYVLNNKLAL